MATDPLPEVIPPTPLEEAMDRLAAYMRAERAILNGAQSYQFGDGADARMLTRADLRTIQAGIKEAKRDVLSLSGRGRPGIGFVQ